MSVDATTTAAPDASAQPARVLGPIDAACVVIGAIIGVGIFFTPTNVAKLAGSGELAMVAWAVGGLIALCGALTFAELGARFNAAGAQYDIIRTTWGSLTGFLFVFCISTVIVPGATAIIAIICARNLGAALGIDLDAVDTSGLEQFVAGLGVSLEPGWLEAAPVLSVSAVLVLGLLSANLAGARWGAGIQNVTVYAKVTTLLAVTVLAIGWGGAGTRAVSAESTTNLTAGLSPVAGVLAALVPAFFSYGGWQQALWVSGEVRDPRRTLPRAIVAGTAIVILVYLLVNWAYLRLLGETGVMASQDRLAADAVGTVLPAWGARFVAGAVAVSSFGILNVEFLTGPRLTYAMSRDGFFFRVFGQLDRKRGTPGPAIVLLGATTLVLLFVGGENGVNTLLNGVVFVDGVFFILTALALFVLRRQTAADSGHAPTHFRTPLYPFVPLFFVLGELGVVVGAYLDREVRVASLIGAVWIVVGAVVYAVWFRRGRGAR